MACWQVGPPEEARAALKCRTAALNLSNLIPPGLPSRDDAGGSCGRLRFGGGNRLGVPAVGWRFGCAGQPQPGDEAGQDEQAAQAHRQVGRTRPMRTHAAAAAATRVWHIRWPFHAQRKLSGLKLLATDRPWPAGRACRLRDPSRRSCCCSPAASGPCQTCPVLGAELETRPSSQPSLTNDGSTVQRHREREAAGEAHAHDTDSRPRARTADGRARPRSQRDRRGAPGRQDGELPADAGTRHRPQPSQQVGQPAGQRIPASGAEQIWKYRRASQATIRRPSAARNVGPSQSLADGRTPLVLPIRRSTACGLPVTTAAPRGTRARWTSTAGSGYVIVILTNQDQIMVPAIQR